MTSGAPKGSPVDIEAAAFAVGFSTALRRAGLPSSPDRTAWLAQALRIIPPTARDRLYWTCRVILVSSREQLPVFDAVFSSAFDGLLDPADARGDTNSPPAVGSAEVTRAATGQGPASTASHDPAPRAPVASPGAGTADESGAPEREAILAMASPDELLREKSFAELTPDETAHVRQLVRRIVLSTPERRSRRTRQWAHAGGELDLRRTIRAARRTGADTSSLVFAHRRPRPRRLVFLCDVSGSMEPYTQVFLSLLQGAVAGAQAEAFVFSTRLTRLTRQLSNRNVDKALALGAAAAPDWAGGTRLAESLRHFIDGQGRRGLARGAVIVVLSDGWAQDAPALVDAQMARLRRLAYRIVWVNPRKAGMDYQPLVGGMAAALPYCDAFVSGHNYDALAEAAAAIRADRRHPASGLGTKWRNR
ncbi:MULTISPECIES: VWA domain-containing protein [Arthrobacter]|uniref:VWA domain-containing protein n=1 Tax=Arthrobacter terricola TaxID=2547396 RepID=A0A4R5KND9_9MICC|nr:MULTISPECIES: VWA domain-containing protein [Arthrobacter]MBT8161303.1 VWA domain-containing protein [Arthrobacter sp. GN70]TDF96100.1 VWA domain-containing protein [Arthrobacter terricola]